MSPHPSELQPALPLVIDTERTAVEIDFNGTKVRTTIDEFGNRKLYILDPLPGKRNDEPVYLSEGEYNFINDYPISSPIHPLDIPNYNSIEYIISQAKSDTPDVIAGRKAKAKKAIPEHFREYVKDERIGKYLQLLQIKKAQNTTLKHERAQAIEEITQSMILLLMSESRRQMLRRPSSRGIIEFGDYLNESQIILMRCIDRYDTASQIAFSTYYIKALSNNLKQLYRQYKRIIHIPSNIEDARIEGTLPPEKLEKFNRIAYLGELDEPSKYGPEEENFFERTLRSLDENNGDEIGEAQTLSMFTEILERTLSETELKMLHLKYGENKSGPQIAEIFGVGASAINSRLSRIEGRVQRAVREFISSNRVRGVEVVF